MTVGAGSTGERAARSGRPFSLGSAGAAGLPALVAVAALAALALAGTRAIGADTASARAAAATSDDSRRLDASAAAPDAKRPDAPTASSDPGPAAASGSSAPVVALGRPGDTWLRTIDCADGKAVASAHVGQALSAPLLLDPQRRRAYAATVDGTISVLALPGLEPLERVAPGFVATALAIGPGEDGFLLAGGRGKAPLAALAPDSLATIHRYGQAEGRSVATIVSSRERRRFLVGFSDAAEAWEIAWNRDAPPVLLGYVHDYRNREAVPLPGRLTPRPFELPSPTREFVAGAATQEVLRIDTDRRAGVVNLEVRREIERFAPGLMASAALVAPWRADRSRGWLLAPQGGERVDLVESGAWEPGRLASLPGEVIALAPTGATASESVLAAHRSSGPGAAARRGSSSDLPAHHGSGPGLPGHRDSESGRAAVWVTRIALPDGRLEPLWTSDSAIAEPVRFARAADGCTALLDAHGRWLAAFPASPVSPRGR